MDVEKSSINGWMEKRVQWIDKLKMWIKKIDQEGGVLKSLLLPCCLGFKLKEKREKN
jgi:hypothetical protein